MMPVSALFVILVGGVMIAAPAGFVQGHAQGTDSQIMTCKEQHVLAERSNGKYACVYKSTAEKLGWTVITVTTQTDDMSEPSDFGEASGLQVSESDEQYWFSSDFAPLYMQYDRESSDKKYVSPYIGPDPLANITKGEIMPFWSRDDSFPYVQVKIPKSTPMTDTMTVTVNYDFTPKHGTEFNPENIIQHAQFNTLWSGGMPWERKNPDNKIPYRGAVFLVMHPPQIKMISDYPTVPYSNDEHDCNGISWIVLPYNGNVPHQAEISFVATAPIPRMEEIFRISSEYSGVTDRSQWYISTDDDNAIVVTPFPKSSDDFDVRSESGINIHLDKNYYTWTDRVYITITAQAYNADPESVDSIGGIGTDTGMITVSTGAASIEGYELTETGKDTGVFAGHVTLTGFPGHLNLDGVPNTIEAYFELFYMPKYPINPRTGGAGSTGGFLATATMPDQFTVSFLSSGSEYVIKSAPIRWNTATVQWFDAYRDGEEDLLNVVRIWSFFIRLVDPDMNHNPDSADAFDVRVYSRIKEAGVSVVETGNATGIFEGTARVTSMPPAMNYEHVLGAWHEEIIYAPPGDVTVSDDMCNSIYIYHAVTMNERTAVGDFTYPSNWFDLAYGN